MPPANQPRRPKCARVKIFYDDEPDEGDASHDVTITQATSGRLLHSTSLASGSQVEPSISGDFTDPWSTGFFDENSEAFVADSLPDDVQDLDVPGSQLPESEQEPKDQRKVWCLHLRVLLHG